MKDFFTQNWRLIMEALLVLVSFIFMIVRKKPTKVIETIQGLILRLLPGLINSAEMTDLKGEAKLQYVLDELVKILYELGYGSEVVALYLSFARSQVEVILSTPQKKVRSLYAS